MIAAKADINLPVKPLSACLKWRSCRALLLLACLAVASTDLHGQTGPGGVGNTASARLWLKADANVYRDAGVTLAADGNQVRQWNDFSGNLNNAVQLTSGNQPVYKVNIVNNSPALLFNGNAFLDASALGIPGTGEFSIIVVCRPTSYTPGPMDSGDGDYIIDRIATTNELTSLKITNTNKFGFQKRDNGNSGLGGPLSSTSVNTSAFAIIDYMRDRGTDYRLYYDGSLEGTVTDGDGNLTPPSPRIGRHATIAGNGLRGYISEVIIYNYRINSAQINIVNSYLGAKYGISVTNDRYFFDATHKYDVAGIGRDTPGSTNLSATSAGILNISNASSMGDGEYLLFGHDNGSISAWDNEAPAGIEKIPREWKLDETGSVGTLNFTVDLSSFPAASCSKYVLLVDADGDFTNATVYDLTPLGSNLYRKTNLSIVDGTYLSIGVRKAPTASITPDPARMCAGGTINLNGNPAGGSGSYSHSWTGNTAPLSSTSIANPAFSTATPNTYNLTYTVTDGYGCSASDAISVTVAADPAITIQPSGVTICSGSTAVMSVTATGGTPSLVYQWEESDDNGVSDPWTNATGGSGSATATYTTPPLGANRFYRVVVSATGNGCGTVTSNGAKVTVVPDLSIATQPSGGVICYNSTHTMTIVVTGGGTLSYQWQVSPNGIGSWTAVGTDNPAYTTPPVIVSKYYRVIVTTSSGGCTSPVTSNVAAVTLESVAPVITGSIAPSDEEGCPLSYIPPAVNSVAELELLGLNITDACTPDATLVVTHADASSGSCPKIFTRTYKVTDEGGNFSTYDQIINVVDTQKPVITGALLPKAIEGCSSTPVPLAATTVAALEALPGGISISDNCTPDASLTVSHTDAISGSCPKIITRTYRVTDQCGNFTGTDHVINIDDTQPPIITGTLAQITVQGCGGGDAPAAETTVAGLESLAGGISISDACTPDASLSVTYSDMTSGSCPWIVTRTYTITDECSNPSFISQTIKVEDTEPPVVTGSLLPVTVEGCNVAAAPAAVNTVAALESLAGAITVTDGCTPDALLVVTHSEGITGGQCPASFVRTYTVTDGCNNSVTINQTININDTQPPVVSGALADIALEGCGAASAPAAATTVAGLESLVGNVSITDICTPDINMNVTHTDAPSGGCINVITRTYTVSDPCLNAVTLSHKITVSDTQAPVVTGSLSDTNIEGCGAGAAPAAVTTVAALQSLPGTLSVTDACTPAASLIVTHSDGIAGSCPTVITRTYTVTDLCGHSADIVHVINVDDTQPPFITGSLTTTFAEGCDAGDAPAAATTVAGLEALEGSIAITDACTADAALLVTHLDAVSGKCPTSITRTYTITDDCGNASSIIHTIELDDTQAPIVVGSISPTTIDGCNFTDAPPAVTTVADLEALDGGILITDACSPDDSLTVSSSDNFAGLCQKVILRTYKISDKCGNFVNINHTINVEDHTPPTFTAPPDITIYKDADCNFLATVAITGDVIDEADNCDVTLTATYSDVLSAGACQGEQIITRTWSLADDCSNTTTHVQIITVEDNTPPTFTTPPDITIFKDAACNYNALVAVTGDVTDEADNCDNTLDAVFTDAVAAGTCPGEEIITRTWSLTDDCHNTTAHIQIITVKDNTPPTFTVPPDITIFRDAACNYDASVAVTGDVTDEADNCDNTLDAIYGDVVTGGTCPGELIITRTWSLTDDCTNTTTHVQIITVEDNTPPTFTAPPDITIFKDAACSYDATVAVTGDVTDEADNCDNTLDATFTDVIAAGTCDGEEIITRTWSLTDDCHNTTTHVQIITVEDNTPPTFTAPPDITIFKDATCNYNAWWQ